MSNQPSSPLRTPSGLSTPASPQNAASASKPAATTKPKPARTASAGVGPISKKDFGFDEARHLLDRAGFGGTPEQVQTLVQWGPEKSVDALVNFEKVKGDPVKEDQFDKDIMRPPTDEERMEQRQAAAARDENRLAELRVRRQNAEQRDREQMRDIQRWWLKRLIETPRPLEEKMTLFWHGHFATSYRTIEDSYHMFQQNQMFRRHAVGNFGEMLYAIIRDPAMIKYLNNDQSRKGKPNENLAREIMELFSLGVGNYSEQDIKEGARALTGYTFHDDTFAFEKNNHDGGGKNILGHSGNMDGDDFVTAILETRACSKYIATKLYKFFVHDYPTGRPPQDRAAEAVISDLESTLLASKYQIAPVLRRLFLSQHFYDPTVRNEQIKSPVQLVVGTIRSLNTPARDLSLLASAMDRMGQNIFFPPSVKGWDGGRSWINTSTMFIRQNTVIFLLTGKRPEGRDALADQEKFDGWPLVAQLAAAFPGTTTTNTQDILDNLLRFTVGRKNPGGRGALEEFIQTKGGKLEGDSLTELMMLISSMPEFQLC